MRHKIIAMALSLLVAVPAFADFPAVRNDSAATTIAPSNGGASLLSVDSKGRLFTTASDPNTGLVQSVIPLSQGATSVNGTAVGVFGFRRRANDTAETGSTTTVINATAHAAVVGDMIYFQDGVASEGTTFVTAVAINTITVSPALRAAPGNGDNFIVGIPAPIGATTSSGSAGPPVLNTTIARGDGSGSIGSAVGAGFFLKSEDAAFADTDAVGMVAGQSLSAIAQSVGASGDIAPPAQDLGNRQVTTLAPAGETWQACSASNTGTGNVTIKGLVASNRIYVTSISCGNQSAISSQVNFKDGTTTIYVGWVAPNTGNAGFDTTMPIPLRLTSGTDFNFSLSTTATSTICCAAGYISTI